jgi:N-acetylmuramoyl-L-alanine amidase
MIFTQCGLRRRFETPRRLAFGIAFFLFTVAVILGRQWDREGAKQAWDKALLAQQQLAKSTEPSRQSYLKCIQAFQQVYFKDPHYFNSDDAVFEAAKLYQSMAEKFGNSSDYRSAAKLFRFLASDYDTSPLCAEALVRLASILEGPLGDAQGAEEAYSKLRKQYRSSPQAAALAQKETSSNSPSAPIAPPAQSAATQSAAARSTAAQSAAASMVPPVAVAEVAGAENAIVIKNISYLSGEDSTRVNIVADGRIRFLKDKLSDPDRVYYDIENSKLSNGKQFEAISVGDKFIRQIRISANPTASVRIVFDLNVAGEYICTETAESFGLTVEFRTRAATASLSATASRPASANPTPPARGDEKRTNPLQTASPAKIPDPGLPGRVAADSGKAADSGTQNGNNKNVPDKKAVDKEIAEKPSSMVAPAEKTIQDAALAARGGNKSEAKDNVPLEKPKEQGAAMPVPATKNPSSSEAGPALAANLPKANTPKPPPAAASIPIPKVSNPTGSGDRTLTRMLGLKIGRIVLDPGHGGHDTGSIGPSGLLEKDLVLGVCRELKNELEEKLHVEVILTRSEDKYISLEERTEMANRHQADLFISVHANSSTAKSISGVETYYLDFARSAAAREVASRENAAGDKNLWDLQDLVQKITRADKIQESKELASTLQKFLFPAAKRFIPQAQNRGIRSAPFMVLIGARMPSVLAEVGFISNPRDEKLLKKDENRQVIASALYCGIEAYMKSLGIPLAQNLPISK